MLNIDKVRIKFKFLFDNGNFDRVMGMYTAFQMELPLTWVLFSGDNITNLSYKEILLAGVVSSDNKIYESPILINFFELNRICIIENTDTLINFVVEGKLFSKNFEEFILLKIHFKSWGGISISDYLEWLIKTLNKLVENGCEIKLISQDKLKEKIQIPSIQNLYHYINILEIKIFEESYNRGVGKDTGFIYYIEISNLPESKYIKDLIIQSFHAKGGRYKLKSQSKSKLIFEGDKDYGWSPVKGIIEITSDSKVLEIKDKIKIFFALNYDEENFLNEFVQIDH